MGVNFLVPYADRSEGYMLIGVMGILLIGVRGISLIGARVIYIADNSDGVYR